MAVTKRGQKRAIETRLAILEAAVSQFASLGFDGTSTRYIAEQAGVNHGLVRHHFGSKVALWNATARSVFERYQERIQVRLSGLEGVDQITVHLNKAAVVPT